MLTNKGKIVYKDASRAVRFLAEDASCSVRSLVRCADGSLVGEVCMESEEDMETTWRRASTSYKSLTRLDPRHYPLSPRTFA